MKLTVGDRVRVYGHSQIQRGNVVILLKDDIISVADETDGADYVVHSKQCRKLVKKVRREFWIRICLHNGKHGDVVSTKYQPSAQCDFSEVIRVREVKEKK